MVKLNIGCGNDYKDGYVNIDQNNAVRCDKVIDLEEAKLPYDDNSVDFILALHVLEHIENIVPLMNELHRILKQGGTMHIEVPKAGTVAYWKDPTHVRGFVMQTFKYFAEWNIIPSYGIKTWEIQTLKEVIDEATDENTIVICEMTKP